MVVSLESLKLSQLDASMMLKLSQATCQIDTSVVLRLSCDGKERGGLCGGVGRRQHQPRGGGAGRGLHSSELELNLIDSRPHLSFNLGHTVDRRAQFELKWKRV